MLCHAGREAGPGGPGQVVPLVSRTRPDQAVGREASGDGASGGLSIPRGLTSVVGLR